MKLYYAPGACSLSPHIVLREAKLPFDLEKVDLKSKTTESGTDYKTVNAKGYVPALRTDDGNVLTEGPAVVQYIADRVPESKLAPPLGAAERYRLMEWLNFISTELHKTFSPLFKPTTPDAYKATAREMLANRFAYVNGQLEGRQFLMGSDFSVADAYLFVMLIWAGKMHIDLAQWPALQQYQQRIASRPAVQAAMKAEGLTKNS